MADDIQKLLAKLVQQAQQDSAILAVILFGSRVRGKPRATSDVDVCLVLMPRRYEPLFLSMKKLEFLKIGKLDVHIYQQLPLYIRRRVIKEGKVLYVRDEESLYELAFRNAQAFEDFKHRYYGYLKQVAHAGS